MSKFAIIELQGKQFKIKEKQIFETDMLSKLKEGDTLNIGEVLLFSENDETQVGAPYLENIKVELKHLEHKRGEKLDVFNYKAKKRYQRNKGHRQELSSFQVISIKEATKTK